MEDPGPDTRLAVDGHVHLHPSFHLGTAFDAALHHVDRAASRDSAMARDRVVLCLAEPEGRSRFRRMRERRGTPDASGWTVHRTEEEASLLARRRDGGMVALVAGRQVRTAERLEVLTLATTREISDGMSLSDTVARASENGAIVVIPWGFGKWWRRRGALVRDLLDSGPDGSLYLGDNAGRLPFGPHLGVFRHARRRGVGVLPGSDPLPLRGQTERVGRYGFLVPAFPLDERPAHALRSRLVGSGEQPASYGSLDPPARALASQVRLRLPRDPS